MDTLENVWIQMKLSFWIHKKLYDTKETFFLDT